MAIVIPECGFAIAPMVAAAIISGAASLVGSWWSTRRSEKFANQQSSTSYQRMVKDLNQAGLNPMLAYQQGHGESSMMPDYRNPMEGVSSAAMQYAINKEQINTQKSIQAANNAAAAKQLADAENTALQTTMGSYRWNIEKNLVGAERNMQYERLQAELDTKKQELQQARTGTERAAIELEMDKIQRDITRLMVPKARFESEQYKYIENLSSPEWLKYIGSFLMRGASTASQVYRNVR